MPASRPNHAHADRTTPLAASAFGIGKWSLVRAAFFSIMSWLSTINIGAAVNIAPIQAIGLAPW